jgi:predicted NBD/HSP70 family sugar kinase
VIRSAGPARKPLAIDAPTAVGVLVRILTRGPIARIDVTRQLRLSAASVTKAVATLMDHGLVTMAEDQTVAPTSPGRPARALRVVPESLLAIGVSVSAGRLVAAATTLRAGVLHVVEDNVSGSSPAELCAAIGRAVRDLRGELGDQTARIGGIGIAVDGSPADGFAGFEGLVRAEFEGERVLVVNAMHAHALTEEWFGAAVGLGTFAVVSVGPQVRCAVFANGGIVSGPHGDGALGRMPSGGSDVDSVVSTGAILGAARRAVGNRRLSLAKARILAQESDPRLTPVLAAAGTALGQATGTVAAITGLELVVVTGDFLTESLELHAALGAAFTPLANGAALVIRSQRPEDTARAAAATVLRHIIESGFRTEAGTVKAFTPGSSPG